MTIFHHHYDLYHASIRKKTQSNLEIFHVCVGSLTKGGGRKNLNFQFSEFWFKMPKNFC
jgi:hypothetical protein